MSYLLLLGKSVCSSYMWEVYVLFVCPSCFFYLCVVVIYLLNIQVGCSSIMYSFCELVVYTTF